MTIDTLDAPATKRELRKQDRRQAIINAARASFLELGYSGTSMSGLLKTLGGSKATLWGYFRSKDELFAAVIDDVSGSFRAELEGVLSSDGELEPTLFTVCRAFLEKISTPEGIATWRLVVSETGRFPEVGKIFYEKAARHTQAMLRAFIIRQIEAGKLAREDPARMAEALISLCVGQHTRALWGLGEPTKEELSENARSYARWFMRAYAPD